MKIVRKWKSSCLYSTNPPLQSPILLLFSHLHLTFCFNSFLVFETCFLCISLLVWSLLSTPEDKPGTHRDPPASASLVLEPPCLAVSYHLRSPILSLVAQDSLQIQGTFINYISQETEMKFIMSLYQWSISRTQPEDTTPVSGRYANKAYKQKQKGH